MDHEDISSTARYRRARKEPRSLNVVACLEEERNRLMRQQQAADAIGLSKETVGRNDRVPPADWTA